MNINYKELLAFDGKWIFFLMGIMLGLLLSTILMSLHKDLNVMELDLKKIVQTYSILASKSKNSMGEIQKDFQEKFNYALKLIPRKTIVVNKGQLLSKHVASDYTKNFIEIMEGHKIDEKKSN